jgi:hypothetical protein
MAPSEKPGCSSTTHEPLRRGKACQRSSRPNADDASKFTPAVRKRRSASASRSWTKPPKVRSSTIPCDAVCTDPLASVWPGSRSLTAARMVLVRSLV